MLFSAGAATDSMFPLGEYFQNSKFSDMSEHQQDGCAAHCKLLRSRPNSGRLACSRAQSSSGCVDEMKDVGEEVLCETCSLSMSNTH